MELSPIKIHDMSPGPDAAERRRRLRHKPHTPAYASFNSSSSGMVVDLSEVLDLHEDGFAVQTSAQLPVNQSVNLVLDLPETKAMVHCTGHVVWGDRWGRAGIRFSGLPEQSRGLLKQWLFINLMVAGTNQAARRQQLDRRPEMLDPSIVQSPVPIPVPDLTGMLAALEAVRRELIATEDVDSAYRLVTERALSLTGASGAALAVLTGDRMTCRARAGEPAPQIGAAVDAKQGISGECVRTGRMINCDDTETDSRIEGDLCRILGIGSILAMPILSDFRVVGLIEVLSPRAHAFTEVHETALDRLAEMVPKSEVEDSAPAGPVPQGRMI